MAEFYDVWLPKFAAGYQKKTGQVFNDRDPQWWDFSEYPHRVFVPFQLFLIWRKENRRRWIGCDLGYQDLQAKRMQNLQKVLV